MTAVEQTVLYEQLVFEGFSSDFSERLYSPTNLQLLEDCADTTLFMAGVNKSDFETRKNEEFASFYGQRITTIHNIMYGVQTEHRLSFLSLMQELYVELDVRSSSVGEKN
jgi:hypothetical protein